MPERDRVDGSSFPEEKRSAVPRDVQAVDSSPEPSKTAAASTAFVCSRRLARNYASQSPAILLNRVNHRYVANARRLGCDEYDRTIVSSDSVVEHSKRHSSDLPGSPFKARPVDVDVFRRGVALSARDAACNRVVTLILQIASLGTIFGIGGIALFAFERDVVDLR